MQHLEAVFQANGFPEGLVKKILSSPQATLGTSRVYACEQEARTRTLKFVVELATSAN